MKRIKRMLAGFMACLMVVTSLGFRGMQAEAAPAGDFEEVSILTSEVTASNDASRTGEDGNWNGYIMGCSNYDGADYFKVVYTVEEGATVSSTDQVFNFQPYNTSWGGWQSNFVKIGESEQDASGNYVCYVAVDTVVSSLSDGELLGINLSYTADVSYGVQLKDLLVCTAKEEDATTSKYTEESIWTSVSNSASSQDASRTGEDGSWNGYILTCSDYKEADYFKVVYNVAEGAQTTAADQVMNFQPYNTSWGGWQSNFVKIGDSEQDTSGSYVCYVSIADIVASLSDGELGGINLSYTQDVSYGVELTDIALCWEKEDDSSDTGVVETLLAGPYAASNDASLYKEDGSYNGYLYSCFSFDGFDELKLTMTIEDTSVFTDATDLYYVSAYNSSWGGWNTTAVKFQNLKTAEDGSYYISLPLENLQPSEGDRYGVNVEYAAAANVTAVTLTGIYAVTLPEAADPTPAPTEAPAVTDTASLNYVKAMGDGWNLGNSFDGVNTNLDEEDLGEEAWGNPVVVKELIQAAADKGYDSIRIPITFYRRFDEETYQLDEEWLARCKEVIQWALDENLYVMINVHHDSWLWLEYWDGDKESEEYKKFTAIWEQYAEYFKDMPEQVMFETINEPVFEANGDITAQDKLDMVNQAAYDAIRNSGGNNATRMIVIPTYTTNHGDEHCEATVAFIEAQNDENLIATVHYYSEWVHSAGIGKTGFDEVLWDDYTPRDSVDLFYETLQKQFLNKGIGVIVGEWGLLGYDSASQVNQAGEELKYYEYMNYYANQTDVCLMFWDNGSGINRTSGDYSWKKPLVGEMLETSMSERSAYVTDLDRVFLAEETDADLSFPLTLNGLTFVGIEGLTEGTDYTYDEASATVTLSEDYVNTKFVAMGDGYGTFAELVFKFSGGADWHEYLIKYAEAVASETTGTVSDIKIPVEFKGSEVRRATAYMASGKVGPNSSWWDYLQYGGAFLPDYETGTIAILSGFWDDPTVVDGAITFHFEMYDGSVMKYTLEKDGENVIGYPALDASEVTLEVADEICVYVGETKIKDTYFNIPKGTGVYGTYTDPENATDYITLTGWPATMTFGTKAQEDSIKIGLLLTYQDREEYPGNITFWLKDAPEVEAVTVDEKAAATVNVKNLADTAVVTYEVADTAVATVAADGTLTGVEEGTTKVIATVTQYGRTDSFEASVTVNHVCSYGDAWKTDAENHWHECECGEKSDLAAHMVAAWTINKAPAKDSAGLLKGTCSVCGMKVTKEMPANGNGGEIKVPQRPGNACKGDIADKDGIIGKIELTDAERIAIENGADLNILLKVMDIINTISQALKDEFANALNGATVGSYLDISLFKQIGDNPEMGITETNGKVKIVLELPEELKNTDANVTRTYSIWHYHNGVVKALDSVFDEATQKVTFETDGFSTFVIAYDDVNNGTGDGGNNGGGNNDGGNTNGGAGNSGNATATTPASTLDTVPKTGETYELIFWLAVMVVAGIGATVYGVKNRKETSEE